MWMPPGCGGPWAAFSSGNVEANPTLEYQNITGDKTYVEAHPTLEHPKIKGDKTYVEVHPTLEYQKIKGICGGPWATAQLA